MADVTLSVKLAIAIARDATVLVVDDGEMDRFLARFERPLKGTAPAKPVAAGHPMARFPFAKDDRVEDSSVKSLETERCPPALGQVRELDPDRQGPRFYFPGERRRRAVARFTGQAQPIGAKRRIAMDGDVQVADLILRALGEIPACHWSRAWCLLGLARRFSHGQNLARTGFSRDARSAASSLRSRLLALIFLADN